MSKDKRLIVISGDDETLKDHLIKKLSTVACAQDEKLAANRLTVAGGGSSGRVRQGAVTETRQETTIEYINRCIGTIMSAIKNPVRTLIEANRAYQNFPIPDNTNYWDDTVTQTLTSSRKPPQVKGIYQALLQLRTDNGLKDIEVDDARIARFGPDTVYTDPDKIGEAIAKNQHIVVQNGPVLNRAALEAIAESGYTIEVLSIGEDKNFELLKDTLEDIKKEKQGFEYTLTDVDENFKGTFCTQQTQSKVGIDILVTDAGATVR